MPLLDTYWSLYLFLPYNPEWGEPALAKFRQKIVFLSKLNVVKELRKKGVEVNILRFTTEMPHESLDVHGQGEVWSGPIIANQFALSRKTYQMFAEEHILLFQEDWAFCVKNSRRSLASFMHHAWLGAPWREPIIINSTSILENSTLRLQYGNGGMSVRSKRFVLHCLDTKEYQFDIER